MKKYLKVWISISVLLTAILLIGCTDSSTQTEEVKTKSIGDNSHVIQVASTLPYPDGIAYDSIEIQSQTEPYELKVFVRNDDKGTVDLKECADTAFAKIDNMGIISFYDKEDAKLIESFTRDEK